MAFKLGMTVNLCMAYNTHVCFDDLDLDARSQWHGRRKKSVFNYMTSNQVISIKLATTAGFIYFFVYITLIVTLKTHILLDHLVFFMFILVCVVVFFSLFALYTYTRVYYSLHA